MNGISMPVLIYIAAKRLDFLGNKNCVGRLMLTL